MQQVQVFEARKRRARPIQAVPGFEQRLVKGLPVVRDQNAERLQVARQGIQLAGLFAKIAHEKLADMETFGCDPPHPH